MSTAGGGDDGPGGPRTGSSSGIWPGSSSGLCGSPGSCIGGGISGRGFPGGLSRGGSVGCPGLIGGSSGGSIGMHRLASPAARWSYRDNGSGKVMFPWELKDRRGLLRPSDLSLDHLQLELGDRLGRVETLGAGLGAIHDGVATIEPERVFEIVQPFASRLIARVRDPAG